MSDTPIFVYGTLIWLRSPLECDQELAQPYIDWVARTDAERDR